jgi:hypothetical protein
MIDSFPFMDKPKHLAYDVHILALRKQTGFRFTPSIYKL